MRGIGSSEKRTHVEKRERMREREGKADGK